ncbi:TonB family protein [Sphingomonas histidinilytica]|uniref:TonB family C-terminal domain-containing protein n=1 Tax=Rhizorhabdus histidinilytica TaxID=439228 RepID=A0A1T5A2Y6_9SPHN|nr:energy transducer TonB [Rhizorhabdus histidinilytica]MBO9376105.1 TonB family protein [Rhizorhabdus histidinilytica]QEH78331.1 TonB family protein [Sphingomonas sp. C8-2]SKB29097.1 TonB family C-terminal domain-containing protein [Rhizorhabdus histidinilytica]
MGIEISLLARISILITGALVIPLAAVAEPLGSPQRVDEDQWIGADDYPPSAARLGLEGKVVAQLEVEPSGKPISCTAQLSSGFPLLDEGTCDLLMRRAKYRAFSNRHGNILDSVSISWKLGNSPAGPRKAPTPRIEAVHQDGWLDLKWIRSNMHGKNTGSVQAVIEADDLGKATNCTITASSGNSVFDKRLCKQLMKVSRFRLPADIQNDRGLVSLSWRPNLSGFSLMFSPR